MNEQMEIMHRSMDKWVELYSICLNGRPPFPPDEPPEQTCSLHDTLLSHMGLQLIQKWSSYVEVRVGKNCPHLKQDSWRNLQEQWLLGCLRKFKSGLLIRQLQVK